MNANRCRRKRACDCPPNHPGPCGYAGGYISPTSKKRKLVPFEDQTPDGEGDPDEALVAAFDRAARRLAEQRQQMAHEGGQRTGMTCPAWADLGENDQEMAVLEARNWLFAARRAGLLNNATQRVAQEAWR